MRGDVNPQQSMFSYVSPEARVPATHPLRAIKARADEVWATLERTFDEMYGSTGRPSLPPERLLKSELLMARFSMRGHRLFCEELAYNILFRWVLDMSLDEPGFDHSTFSQNSERLLHTRWPSASLMPWSPPRAARGCSRMSTSRWTVR